MKKPREKGKSDKKIYKKEKERNRLVWLECGWDGMCLWCDVGWCCVGRYTEVVFRGLWDTTYRCQSSFFRLRDGDIIVIVRSRSGVCMVFPFLSLPHLSLFHTINNTTIN